jgi:preprotein translocase subunit SecA
MASNDIPLIGPLISKIAGSRNERVVKRYTSRVGQIRELEPQMRTLTDEQLRGKLEELRKRHDEGVKSDELQIEAFAVAREAMDRHVGIRNIFNPEHGFDPSVLSEAGQKLYAETKAVMDARAPLVAKTVSPELRPQGGEDDVDDTVLGSPEAVPGWVVTPIPVELYEEVRRLYPESRPPFRARPFDVQLIGGMVLGQGKIAEMKTGEGKTIVAPLATYMASIERQQVHVVTVNDYLVQRDRDWTFPFFHWLGLTVGAIHPMHMQPEEIKRFMYRCDVVYGTTSEFGFDYLRDNMKRSVEQQVQRKRQFAIVDEVDSTLIDEARTPLIISGMAHDDAPRYDLADRLAKDLVEKQRPWQEIEDRVTATKERIKGLEGDIRQTREKEQVPQMQKELDELKARLPELERERDQHTQYYELELDRKQAHLTHEGITEAQRVAGVGSFYVDENMDIPHLLEQSLRAYAVYTRDKDYIVMDVPDRQTGRTEPSVVIVDTNTGRPMIGRQWSDGLHQAVEAKEGVPIKPETQTVATVTIQNFFKMYKRLAGMTGTADTEAQEFHDIYKLDVVTIPTNKPIRRSDFDDLMYLRAKDKWEAIVDEIKRFHDLGRPILVGTTSVEKSEMLAQMLTRKHGVKHNVLNAKQHEREAHVVEDAGQLGAVMIATNMAGRGTDIKLGKVTREDLLDHWLRRSLCSRDLTVDATEQELRENVYRKIAQSELKDEGLRKRDIEDMDFAELELKLLRHWAAEHTWLSEGKIQSMDAEALREELDKTGRILIHRVRWYENIEDLGGLHVIGTERHESRRIDNQLRGRSGRQGDNGSSRFYVSLEDDLMKMFAGETTMKLLSRLGMKEGDAIEHPWLSKNVEKAQRKVEERNFQVRKNILEYDEVMEHQRQRFYGLRQRVLEGRDVKGLIFEYIDEAIDDAIDEYLDRDFPALCAAEYAKRELDCSIMPDRLKGKDLEDMERTIRQLAKEDVAATIGVTIGEYMPVEGSEVSVDFDSAGLVGWASRRFGVELDAGELREGGASERRQVTEMLERAAHERIDKADLSGLAEFTQRDYGARRLSEWVKAKFTFEVSAEEIAQAQRDDEKHPRDLIIEKARELYRQREIEYPVDFALQMAMNEARQSPQEAFERLATWARNKYQLELTADEIKAMGPAKIRERLLAESRAQIEENRLDAEIDRALATSNDEELEAYLRERFTMDLPERMRYLDEEEREDAIRALVENQMRAELLMLERLVLLDTLDSTWKDHLYQMDQLRDSIGFRVFSQQDPRIEYKREGQRQFLSMMESVRDRVTDFIFKARMAPQGGGGPRPAPAPRPAPPRPPAPVGAAPGFFGGAISGPGFGGPVSPAPPRPAGPGQPKPGSAEGETGSGPSGAG